MKPTIKIKYSIKTNETATKIFWLFKNLTKYYTEIHKGHYKFKIIGASCFEPGSFIECEEESGKQHVQHKYFIEKLDTNKYIKLVSESSKVTIWNLFNILVKTIVEFRIQPNDDKTTNVLSELTLEFTNNFEKLFAILIGTRKIWETHLKEEMEGVLKIIETKVDSNF